MLKWITKFTHKIEKQAVETGLIYRLASRYYNDVVRKEAVLASITQEDHILCIGGGICPFTAILFHQLTGAKVTVIDKDEKCIPKARKVISRLKLNEQVRVLHKDGNNVDLGDYSVIHVALQVSPMEKVLSSIESQITEGTRLLVRRPKIGARLLSYCPYTTHKARNIGSTVLYIKQDIAA